MTLTPNITSLAPLVRHLHRFAWLRRLARRCARNVALTQRFHGGRIAFNAVAHSWAWIGDRRYENFDRPLQDRLLALSLDRPQMLDIGANIGAMTLSVLLRNPRVQVVAVEPGQEAAALLGRSLRLNRLQHRCKILPVAVSDGASRIRFDATGSVVGHVTDTGTETNAIGLGELIRELGTEPVLVKIDVEGYETVLLQVLADLSLAPGSCAVIELHPLGFNDLGNPQLCLEILQKNARLKIHYLAGGPVDKISATDFTQIEVSWL